MGICKGNKTLNDLTEVYPRMLYRRQAGLRDKPLTRSFKKSPEDVLKKQKIEKCVGLYPIWVHAANKAGSKVLP